MNYDWTAIPDAEVPPARHAVFDHVVRTYASETNKTASLWRAVDEEHLGFRPHDSVHTIEEIMQHQLLSERRFFAQFVGTDEPPAEEVLPPDRRYVERYVALAKARLPQIAHWDEAAWLEPRPFFGETRQRIWVFWRRVLHTCHHRTQVQAWLRLAGARVPAIYGPSGDVTWSEATPTWSVSDGPLPAEGAQAEGSVAPASKPFGEQDVHIS